MNLVFLGTGPAIAVKGRGKNYRSNSSLLLETKKGNILIDATPMIEEQLFKNAIDKIDAVLITHMHSDCVKGLPKVVERFGKIPVYTLKHNFNLIHEIWQTLELEEHDITPGKPFQVLGVQFTPFRVIHAEPFPTGEKYPCLGFRFNDVLYAEDMESVPSESEKYFENVDLMIIDAAMYFDRKIRGHMNTEQALQLIKKYKPKRAILTQIGKTYPDHYKAQKRINEYCKFHGISTDVRLAYDGMVIENLQEIYELFRYVGSKRLNADEILAEIPKDTKTFFDPMTGSSVIAWRMKQRGAKVIVNDISPVAYYYSKAILGNYKLPQEEFEKFLKAKPVEGWLTKSNLKRPGSVELRKYIDGLVTYAHDQKNPVKDFLLAICADMLTRFMGSFGVFRPYKWTVHSAVEFAKASYADILKKIIPGEAVVTNKDIFDLEIPNVEVIYWDPPYDIKEGDEVPYTAHQYKNINSILMQKDFVIPEFDRQKIPELIEKLAKKCKIILVSTSDSPYIDYKKILSQHKKEVTVKKLKRKSRGTQPSSVRPEVREYTDLLWIAKDSVQLAENRRTGIYLVKPHAEMIYNNEKKLIVKSRNYKNMLDKPLYLLDNEFCYGIIKLTNVKKISLKEFEELREKHKITETERKEWWDDKNELYAYEFEWVEHFPEPKPAAVPKGTQTFVENWSFATTVKNQEDYKFHRTLELIQDIYNYNAHNMENEVLADDFRLAVAYYSRILQGKKIKFTKEQIIQLATKILKEIARRKKSGRMNWTASPEYGSEAYKKLWEAVDLTKEERNILLGISLNFEALKQSINI